MATRYTDTEQSARNSSRLDRIGRTDERARRCSRVSTRSNPRCERVQLEQKASFVKQRRKGVNPLRPRGRFFYLLSLSHRQGGPTIKPFSPSLSLLSPPLSLSLSLSRFLPFARRVSSLCPSSDRPRFVLFSLLFSSTRPFSSFRPSQHGFLIGTIISVRSSSRKLIRIFYYETENS